MVDVLERPRKVVDKEEEHLAGEIVVDQVKRNRNWGSRKTLPIGACCLLGQPGKRLVTHLGLSEKPRPSRRERPAAGGKGENV